MTNAIAVSEAQRDRWLRDAKAAQFRRSFARFFREGFHVIEPVPLLWNWHIELQCQVAQAFAEGWLVSKGYGTPAMVERQRGYWRAHGLEWSEGECLVKRLAVNGGPGTLKSRIWMVYLQAWVWLFAPGAHFVATSSADKNVTRDSNYTKELVKSPWYRETFGITWRVGFTASGERIDGVERWVTSAGGERMSQPWMSQWTGQRGDFLLGDDPNDAFTVTSKAAREEAQAKYDLAIGSRMKLGGVQMMLQQHVDGNDVTSVLKTRGADVRNVEEVKRAMLNGMWSPERRDRWASFVLPVEFHPERRSTNPWRFEDPRTELGEVLFAKQWTPEVLAAEKERLALYPGGWEAQGNQNPGQGSSGEVKAEWWRFCVISGDPAPVHARPSGCVARGGDGVDPPFVIKRRKDGRLELDWLVISVDPKNGGKKQSSSNVGLVVVGGLGNRRFVLDDRTERLGFIATLDAIKAMILDWSEAGLTGVLVEKKAQGAAATESINDEIANAKLVDSKGRPIVVPLIEVEGGSRSFEDRFNATIPLYRAGLIHVLDGAMFAGAVVSEVCSVPNGTHDDRADAIAQACNHFTGADPTERWKTLATMAFRQ